MKGNSISCWYLWCCIASSVAPSEWIFLERQKEISTSIRITNFYHNFMKFYFYHQINCFYITLLILILLLPASVCYQFLRRILEGFSLHNYRISWCWWMEIFQESVIVYNVYTTGGHFISSYLRLISFNWSIAMGLIISRFKGIL